MRKLAVMFLVVAVSLPLAAVAQDGGAAGVGGDQEAGTDLNSGPAPNEGADQNSRVSPEEPDMRGETTDTTRTTGGGGAVGMLGLLGLFGLIGLAGLLRRGQSERRETARDLPAEQQTSTTPAARHAS